MTTFVVLSPLLFYVINKILDPTQPRLLPHQRRENPSLFLSLLIPQPLQRVPTPHVPTPVGGPMHLFIPHLGFGI